MQSEPPEVDLQDLFEKAKDLVDLVGKNCDKQQAILCYLQNEDTELCNIVEQLVKQEKKLYQRNLIGSKDRVRQSKKDLAEAEELLKRSKEHLHRVTAMVDRDALKNPLCCKEKASVLQVKEMGKHEREVEVLEVEKKEHKRRRSIHSC